MIIWNFNQIQTS